MKIRLCLKWGRNLLAALLVAGFVLVAGQASNAFAHEDRDVLGGKYQFRVGFSSEPTYQGLPNGVELTVCTGTCVTNKDGSGTFTNGVTGLFDTIKVEVTFGDQSITLPLVAVPRNPGRYNANFIPTRTGDYTFHFFGTIGPDKIDEKFTSGPNTFDSVLPLTAIQFPDKPGYVNSPVSSSAGNSSPAPATTVATSATTVAASTPAATPAASPATSSNNDAVLQQLQAQLQDQKQQLETAKNSAASASTFGIIGIVAGILGIIIAVATFLFGSRGKGSEPEAG